MRDNKHLQKAQVTRDDEFYTRREDIEAELRFYDFKGKYVHLPCDTEDSEFFKFFKENFYALGLKQLTAIGLRQEDSHAIVLTSSGLSKEPLVYDGCFRTYEGQGYIKKADVVVTNPPFSGGKFGDLVQDCLRMNKEFLLIGAMLAPLNSKVGATLVNYRMRNGFNAIKSFNSPDGIRNVQCQWWTNMPSTAPDKPFLELKNNWSHKDYKETQSYIVCSQRENTKLPLSCLVVDSIRDIPNYGDFMMLPPNMIAHWNPNQFELFAVCIPETQADEEAPIETQFVRFLVRLKD